MGEDEVSGGGTALTDITSRAAALAALHLTYPVEDLHLDALCALTANQCDAAMAVAAIIDGSEPRILGAAGAEPLSNDIMRALCTMVVVNAGPATIADTDSAPFSLAHAPAAPASPMRFYAAVPITTPEGILIGAIAIAAPSQRDGLNEAQWSTLRLIADAAMDHLLARQIRTQSKVPAEPPRVAEDDDEWRFRLLADAMPQMVWSSRPDGLSDYFNARWYSFTGASKGESPTQVWRAAIHPDDWEKTITAWRHAMATDTPFDMEYRLRQADGQYRWILARGASIRGPDGAIMRWFGACTDIHDHKLAMEERELISQELAHRIKNIFAVISGLISLSAREFPESRPFVESLRNRILALGRAHDFVRPHGLARSPASGRDGLHGLLREIFAPYDSADDGRIIIAGEDVQIDDRAATPLALTFHEIATNAAKYGALSLPGGTVRVTVTREPPSTIVIVWEERGGPPIAAIQNQGFGSRLLELCVNRQLGGAYQRDWSGDGLTMEFRIPVSAFSR